MLIKSLLTPPSTLIDFLSLKIKGILKLSFGLYPQVGYIVIVLSFRTENRINIDQNYRSGDVWSDEFPIVSVKLFYWLEYFIQKNRTSLRDRSQFVAICVVCRMLICCQNIFTRVRKIIVSGQHTSSIMQCDWPIAR